jgi:hypothetical protein
MLAPRKPRNPVAGRWPGLLALVAVLPLLCAAGAAGQGQEAGIRFLVADPTGTFGDQVDDPGFGLALHWGVRPDPALTLGVGGHVAIYGSESRRLDLPLVDDVDLTTTNNLAAGFLLAQWRPVRGAVQPYAEGRLGLQYLWTESELEDADWWDQDDVGRQTNLDDWATFWSAGGGLLIRLREVGPEQGPPGVLLDLKATWLRGSEAEYLTEGAVTLEGDRPVFAVSESTTDLVTYELGVVLTF